MRVCVCGCALKTTAKQDRTRRSRARQGRVDTVRLQRVHFQRSLQRIRDEETRRCHKLFASRRCLRQFELLLTQTLAQVQPIPRSLPPSCTPMPPSRLTDKSTAGQASDVIVKASNSHSSRAGAGAGAAEPTGP